MACRNSISKIPSHIVSKTTTVRSATKSSGGGDSVIAGGDTSNHDIHQNNNKSASSLVHQTHLLNSIVAETFVQSASENLDAMAGDIRLVDGKKQRKLWNLRDRSEMSVHLLKANLAEDGCDEAQLDVAKKLLQDVNDLKGENSRLAIYWLIKSSEQGNDEATQLLKECLSAGRGITGQNILDVKTCISTPANEKLTFRAARLLYQKLNNGEEFITTTQLLAYINPPKKISDKNLDDSLTLTDEFFTFIQETSDEDEDSGPTTAEKNQKIPLKLPGLNETFTLPSSKTSPNGNSISDPQSNFKSQEEEEEDASEILGNEFFTSEMLLKQEGVKLTVENLLKAAGSFNSGNSPIPTIDSLKKQFKRHDWKLLGLLNLLFMQVLMFATFGGQISFKECLYMTMTLLSIWASYNILLWQKRYSNFKDWSMAFSSVLKDRKWSEEDAENKITLKLLLPYLLCHIVTLLVTFLTNGLNPLKIVVGLLIIFSLFRGVIKNRIPRWKVMLMLCFSSLPNMSTVAMTSIEMIMDEVGFGDYHVSEWMKDSSIQLQQLLPTSIPVEKHMILTSLQLILVTSLVWTRRNLLLQEIVPEILCTLWFIKVFQISLQLTTYEIVLCGLIFCLLGLILIILESRMETWKVSLSITLILAISISAIFTAHIMLLKENTFGVDFLRFQNQRSTNLNHKDLSKLKLLQWEDYDEKCHRKSWKSASFVETQLKCLIKYVTMDPIAVRWRGRLSGTKVKELDPKEMKNVVFELSIYIITPETVESVSSWQSFLPGTDNENLIPATVLVSTWDLSDPKDKQRLIDHILYFKSGDKIEFHGMFNPTSAGSLKPEIIHVNSFQCISCAINENFVEYFVENSKESVQSNLDSENETGESLYFHLLNSVLKSFESVKSYFNVLN